MNFYSGTTILEKIAVGRIFFYKKCNRLTFRKEIGNAEQEIARFDAARDAALEELDSLIKDASCCAGEEEAAEVFQGHWVLIQDYMYRDFVCDVIREQGVNAEFAIAEAQKHFAGILMGVDDDYMRDRAEDIADISERLLRLLGGDEGMPDVGEEDLLECGEEGDFILAAEELTPSDTMRLDRERICGFIVRQCAANSHTAILARAMDIPIVFGVDVQEDWDGRMAVIDGCAGDVILDPDEECLERMLARKKEIDEREAALDELRGQETVTRGGRKINLYANISDGADVDAALENGADGIGLFRSEFLYLQSSDWPTEKEQFAAYRAVVEAMNGKRVVIRTLDAGVDKELPYLRLGEGSVDHGTSDDAAGRKAGSRYRGIRICLDRPEMFRTQLRAILRAAAYGRVAVMFPMITSAEEVLQCREQLALARDELDRADPGTPYGGVEIGIMVETAEAVEICDELAGEVDFFSIGTNDLIPELFGIDRFGGGADNREYAHRPEVMNALDKIVRSAHAEGIRAGVCGELAADTEMTERLVDMGVDELSVTPAALLRVREAVRGME